MGGAGGALGRGRPFFQRASCLLRRQHADWNNLSFKKRPLYGDMQKYEQRSSDLE